MTCRSRPLGLALALLFMGGVGDLQAQQGTLDAMVEVRTTTGMSSQRLTGWSETGPRLASRGVPADWLEVIVQNGAVATAPWRLDMADGLWLPGAPGSGDGDAAIWRTPDGIAVPIDLLWVRSLWRDRRPGVLSIDRDYIWLATSGESLDRRSGYLLGWEATGVEFESEGGDQQFSWDRLQAVRLVPEPVNGPAEGAWIVLATGGLLYGQPRSISGTQLVVDLPWHKGWKLPLRAVASIRRRGADIIELGRQTPAAIKGPTEAPGELFLPRAGVSVEGRPLRVAGREYSTGFGTRVPSEVAFDQIGPGQLVVRVGIDDEVKSYRNPQPVVFRVLLDDEELARSRARGVGETPEDLLIEIPRAGRLRLIAEPADKLPFGGHADWLDPLFLPAGTFDGAAPTN